MNQMNKNELKYIQSFAQKKHWTEESVYLIEGPKMLEEALGANCPLKKIYATQDWLAYNQPGQVEIEEVDELMLSRLSQLHTANQVLALVEKKPAQKVNYSNRLSLVLDGIQDPGNLGTIIRTADWFGIDHIIVSEDTASVYNPKVIQSTMGSCFRVQVKVENMEQVFIENKLPVIGTLLSGNSIYETVIPLTGFLIIGNESKGIRTPIQSYITHPVAIPKFGAAESLNAAVATGIVLSKWKMQ
jgi:TrmH family RNA methyltransferase